MVFEAPRRSVLEEAAGSGRIEDACAAAAALAPNLRGSGSGLVEAGRSLSAVLPKFSSVAVLSFSAASAEDLYAEELDELIDNCREAGRIRSIPVLLIFHGSHAMELSGAMLREGNFLSGLAALHSSGEHLEWRTQFWHSSGFHAGETQVRLVRSAQPGAGFDALAPAEARSVTGDDERIWSAAPILESDDALGTRVRQLAGNQEVYERGLESSAATLVFRIESPAEIRTVAEMISNLRILRGRLLKIAVVEVSAPLRASTEAFLLACGANLVFEPSATAGHVRVMLSSLSGVVFPHEPATNFESMARSYEIISVLGKLPAEKFLELAENAVRSPFDHQDVHGAFVLLEPDPRLTAEEAMTQFSPRRSGDIGAVLGNRCAVFLSGCHPSYIELSLQRTFLLDPALIFHSYRAVFEDRDVLAQIARCRSFLNGTQKSTQVYDRMLPRRQAEATPKQDAATAKELRIRLMRPNPITPVRCGNNESKRSPK